MRLGYLGHDFPHRISLFKFALNQFVGWGTELLKSKMLQGKNAELLLPYVARVRGWYKGDSERTPKTSGIENKK